jgi:hypothetical protein
MERFVARANVAHLLNLLKHATDPKERRILEELLAAEVRKLKQAETPAALGAQKPKPAPPKMRDAAE